MDKYLKRIYSRYQGKMLEDDGAYKSKDFTAFASYVKRQFKNSAAERGINLDSFNVGHYDVSGFFEKDGKYVYFSYSEPRHEKIDFNRSDCYYGFLIRTATSNKDYRGGRNNFSNLEDFMDVVEELFAR